MSLAEPHVFARFRENTLTGKKALVYVIVIQNIGDFVSGNPFNPQQVEADVVAYLQSRGALPASDPTCAVFFFESPSSYYRRNTTATEIRLLLKDIELARPESDFWQRGAE